MITVAPLIFLVCESDNTEQYPLKQLLGFHTQQWDSFGQDSTQDKTAPGVVLQAMIIEMYGAMSP